MKYIKQLLLVLAFKVFIPNYGLCQNEVRDRLEKYSALILAISGNQIFTGTGFFFKFHDSTFVVSNQHAITGVDPMRNKRAFIPDSVFLKVKTANGFNFLKLFDAKHPFKNQNTFSLVEDIDLLKVPIKLPKNSTVGFMNDLIDTTYFNKNPGQIVGFGYGTEHSTSSFDSVINTAQRKFVGKYNVDGYKKYDSSLKHNFPKLPSKDRNILLSTQRFYFFLQSNALHGDSGSPLFGQFYDQKKRKVIYRFLGVVFAIEGNLLQTWAIRGDVAYRYLTGEQYK